MTVTVTEKNTSADGETLSGVSVTGGGACASFSPTGPISLAAGATQDFTCTFTAGAAGVTTSWSATGNGTDILGNPVPTTGETASGNVVSINPSTTLTFVSQTPGNPVPSNSSVTLVVMETNSGDSTIHNVAVGGTNSCASWTPVDIGFTGTLASLASENFTCTFTVGTTSVSWSATGSALDLLGVAVPATGETFNGTIQVTPPGQGCTPGFWKNHTLPWDEASDTLSTAITAQVVALGSPFAVTPGSAPALPSAGTTVSLFELTFGITDAQMKAAVGPSNANVTLLGALNTGGGGFFALLRHGTAGLLSSGSVAYTYSTAQVLQGVQAAFQAGNPDVAFGPFTDVLANLAAANNLDESACPTGG